LTFQIDNSMQGTLFKNPKNSEIPYMLKVETNGSQRLYGDKSQPLISFYGVTLNNRNQITSLYEINDKCETQLYGSCNLTRGNKVTNSDLLNKIIPLNSSSDSSKINCDTALFGSCKP